MHRKTPDHCGDGRRRQKVSKVDCLLEIEWTLFRKQKTCGRYHGASRLDGNQVDGLGVESVQGRICVLLFEGVLAKEQNPGSFCFRRYPKHKSAQEIRGTRT